MATFADSLVTLAHQNDYLGLRALLGDPHFDLGDQNEVLKVMERVVDGGFVDPPIFDYLFNNLLHGLSECLGRTCYPEQQAYIIDTFAETLSEIRHDVTTIDGYLAALRLAVEKQPLSFEDQKILLAMTNWQGPNSYSALVCKYHLHHSGLITAPLEDLARAVFGTEQHLDYLGYLATPVPSAMIPKREGW